MAQDETRKVGRPPIAAEAWELHCRVPVTIYDALATEAIQRRVTVNRVIREALQAYIRPNGTGK